LPRGRRAGSDAILGDSPVRRLLSCFAARSGIARFRSRLPDGRACAEIVRLPVAELVRRAVGVEAAILRAQTDVELFGHHLHEAVRLPLPSWNSLKSVAVPSSWIAIQSQSRCREGHGPS
jgi:hypothetical protein